MDFIFQDFASAYADPKGYQLAETLSPNFPPDTLKIIWKSTNHHDAKSYIRRNLQSSSPPMKLSREEIDCWADIYLHYWKAVGQILAVQKEILPTSGKVGDHSIMASRLCVLLLPKWDCSHLHVPKHVNVVSWSEVSKRLS